MALRRPAALNFVERHGLWTARSGAQGQGGRASDQEAQAGTGALLLCRSARRAARQDRGRRRCSGADAQRRHHDDDAAGQGYRAQDGLSGVHRRRRLRHGGNAGRRRFRHGGRPGDISGAAVGPNTGWLLCDIYFTNGKPVPFSTRQILRDALARLRREGFDYLAGLEVEFHLFKLENPRLAPGDATWPPLAPEVSLLNQGYQYLTESRFDQVETALEPIRARHRGARHAAALAGNRTGAEPVRIHLPPASRPCRRRHDDFVPRRRQTDRAPQGLSAQLHVPAGAAQSVFERLASASVADRSQTAAAMLSSATSAKGFRPSV